MTDYNTLVYGTLLSRVNFPDNDCNVHSGTTFLESQQIASAPWNYIIRNRFLKQHEIKFCENVFFEDFDFCLHCIARAERIAYTDFATITYSIRENQITKINSSAIKINEYFFSAKRAHELSRQFQDSRGEIIYNHAVFRYSIIVKRYLWRLKYSDIVRMLNEYNPHIRFKSAFTNFAFAYPKTYAFLSVAGAPFIKLGIKTVKLLKGKQHIYKG